LLAIAFLVFDVELLFLYPWAVAVGGRVESGEWRVESGSPQATDYRPLVTSSPASRPQPPVHLHGIENRRMVFWGVMVFLALLTLGFVYDWRKGVFQWR
jgi:NADH-quinone oxidoreductase subunit A